MSLHGRTLLMSGGSRGIGLAIALRAARDGANLALLAKTATDHPRLAGTIYTAAREIEAAGGAAVPIVGDVRDEADIVRAVDDTVAAFGGIDVVVNNASALDLGTIDTLSSSRFDLMQSVNVRGTYLLTAHALPHLRRSTNPHVLTMSPPIDLTAGWLSGHLAYSMSKYGMSMCTIGFAERSADDGIAVNSLWPATLVATAAVRNLLGGDDRVRRSRTPEMVAEAAHRILTRPAREATGQFFIDEDVLRAAGVTDFAAYSVDPSVEPEPDIFIGHYRGA